MMTLELTEYELKQLPEYSTTLPTGTTEGKRWRRALWHGEPELGWVIGEYFRDQNTPPDKISIRWYRPIIIRPPTDAERSSMLQQLIEAKETHYWRWIQDISADILSLNCLEGILTHIQKHAGPDLLGYMIYRQAAPPEVSSREYWVKWSASMHNLLAIFDEINLGGAAPSTEEKLERLRNHYKKDPHRRTPEPEE
jgi:hypothetical protein